MGGAQKFPRLFLSLMGVAGAWGMVATRAEALDAWRSRVSQKLLSIYDNAVVRQTPPPASPPAAVGTDTAAVGPRRNEKGWVQADIHYDCSQDAPTEALISAGLSPGTSVKVGTLCVVEGWVAPESLPRVAAVVGVTRVKVPSYVVHRNPRPSVAQRDSRATSRQSGSLLAQAGSASGIDHNGVSIMRADQFVSQTGTSGAGVTVGVQSTGIASLTLIQGRGELPAVQVVSPSGGSNPAAADEGTALLEEVHAVASGAGLAYCEPDTFVAYASCLGQLISAGATILVDDVVFSQSDLMSSDSPDAQAVEQILTQNPAVALFTAVGNYNGSYWEGQYAPVSLSSLGMSPLTCPSNGATQTDYYAAEFKGGPNQVLTVSQSSSVPLILAWADPPNQNASKFDVYWFASVGNTQVGCLSTASSTDNHLTQKPVFPAANYKLFIATPDASRAGKFLKLWIGGDGLTSISDPTAGSVVTPQAFAHGVISVGAVNGSDAIGNNIETFSSLGPISIFFPTAAKIQAPVLVAPDGINVDAAGTYFVNYLFPDGNFYGTSASAPNAAAVAALIRGAFPNLTVPELVSTLQAGATQLGAIAPDGTFGYGRIDAIGALGTLPAPTITALPASSLAAGSSSPAYPFKVSGTGNLHFSVTSSNGALIPASIVAAGSPGITIAPSGCGVSTMDCTVLVTAANGQSSTVTVTVSAVDGANRSAPASMTITVTGSATPPTTATPTPTATSSGGGGGALKWWEIGLLAMIALVAARRSRAARLY
jgi:hypothetical protein